MPNLLPRQEQFFELFLEQAGLIVAAAEKLAQGVQGKPPGLAVTASEIAELESAGDAAVAALNERLGSSFFTPLDPEDILALTHALDDIIDGIEDTAHRLAAYHIDPVPKPVIRLCEVVESCAGHLHAALIALKGKQPTANHCAGMFALDKTAKDINRGAVAELLNSEGNPMLAMKLREIYGFLNRTMDACEAAAATLQHVHVKNG
ncbi:MAG: DUF47 family protein [Alphaproteobacteria bacterium]|nr:DUF47 family protein [Alphaproteobacteria bacterium]